MTNQHSTRDRSELISNLNMFGRQNNFKILPVHLAPAVGENGGVDYAESFCAKPTNIIYASNRAALEQFCNQKGLTFSHYSRNITAGENSTETILQEEHWILRKK